MILVFNVDSGASKGTTGDAKCVREILGGTKIRKLRGTKFTFLFKEKTDVLEILKLQ